MLLGVFRCEGRLKVRSVFSLVIFFILCLFNNFSGTSMLRRITEFCGGCLIYVEGDSRCSGEFPEVVHEYCSHGTVQFLAAGLADSCHKGWIAICPGVSHSVVQFFCCSLCWFLEYGLSVLIIHLTEWIVTCRNLVTFHPDLCPWSKYYLLNN